MTFTVFALKVTLVCAIVIAICVIFMAAKFAWKLHMTIRQMGSFQCRYRPAINAGWTEGFAVYKTEKLQWHRLVSFSTKPQLQWSRRGINITNAEVVGNDERGPIYELRIHADGHRFFLEMSLADYTGFVAWIEAGPPRCASFL